MINVSSCSKDSKLDNGDQNEVPKEEVPKDNLKSVLLKMSIEPFTHSEGQSQTSVPVDFNSGHLYFTNSDGAILKYFTITSTETSATNINSTALTGTGVPIADLPEGISDVYVVGNSTVFNKAGPINSVRNQRINATSQKDIANLNLYGAAKLEYASGNTYTASVVLAPTVARIELSEIKASGIITSFEVAGVFVDNFYSEATVDGTVNSAKLANNGSTVTVFSDNTPQYSTALKGTIYDWYSPALVSVSKVVKLEDGKSWSYNVFTDSIAIPRIIIRLKNVKTSPGSGVSYTGDQFVTVSVLKQEEDASSIIKSGKIYNKSVTINESVVMSAPNTHRIMPLGTFNDTPRLANGRSDIHRLIGELVELNANEYNWFIWRNDTDWDELSNFLPLAKEHNIKVWVSLAAPSQTYPRTEWKLHPYGADYIKWAEEIAKLSVIYPNLIAMSIDDFTHDLNTFTPSYLGKMIDEFDKVNPNLLFIPCSYYKRITSSFAIQYSSLIDGVLFPYRAESEGANLQNPNLVEYEIAQIRLLFKDVKEDIPVYLDVYSTAHSSLGPTTPEYVRTVIKEGAKFADGIHIYAHPNPKSDKGQVVKEEFMRLSNITN